MLHDLITMPITMFYIARRKWDVHHDLASSYSEALCDVCSRKALYIYTFYLLISLSFRCVLASYMIDELAFKGYYHNHAITSNKDLMKLLPSLNASSDQLL